MSTDNQILSQNPKHQTDEEWWQSHDNAAKYRQASNTPVSTPQKPPEAPQQENTLAGSFQYIDHRTTKQGRVVLEFVHTDTGVLAVKFFNVDVKKYRTGLHGQFTVHSRHKFRKSGFTWLVVPLASGAAFIRKCTSSKTCVIGGVQPIGQQKIANTGTLRRCANYEYQRTRSALS